MKAEKAEYAKICIGPGGRRCTCCAPVSTKLKRLEHRAARRNERKFIVEEMNND